MYEDIIKTLKEKKPRVTEWDHLCINDRVDAAMKAYSEAADNQDTLEMADAIEAYYLDPRTLHLIQHRKYDEMKSLIEESVLNFYNSALCDAFNSSFEAENDIKYGNHWQLAERIERPINIFGEY